MKKNNKSALWVALFISTLGLSVPHLSRAITNISKKNTLNPTAQLVEQLEWISSNDPHNICHGYFVQPQLDAAGVPILPPKQSPSSITADSGIFSQKTNSVLNGNVTVIQPGRRLEANHATVYTNAAGKYQAISMTGNIRAYEPGQLLIADSAYYDFLKKTGVLHNVKYRVLLVPNDQIQNHLVPMDNNQQKLAGPVAWGQAKQAVQTKVGHTSYSEVTYSTCEPDAAQWVLIASKLKLNKDTEYGSAHNARLDFEGVPIFYTPYWSFPLTKKRKTGFLFPLYGTTSVSGLELALPFYWNIAPNYDDTITPTYYSKRSVLFKNEFRYLTPISYGIFNGSFIPNDSTFKSFQNSVKNNPAYIHQPGYNALLDASPNRYSLGWFDESQFNPHWSGLINYARISDDYFLQDFGALPQQITTNQLLQEGQVQYSDSHWVFTGLVEGYQTLHPVNRLPLINAYDALPELSLTGNFPYFWKNLGFTWQSQATYFTRSAILGMPNTNGGRLQARPGFNYPINWVWGYFDPQIQMDTTNYSLNYQPGLQTIVAPNQILPLTYPFFNSISRNLPILNVHSGIYFDRNVNLFHQSYDQTLEPELFYLYVPYYNQNSIPIFDSGLIPFDYSQLFSTNRFSGLDRLGDANQLSYALTTRFIDNQTGDEKFRFGVGQIYYFKEHRVQLCNTVGCSDFLL